MIPLREQVVVSVATSLWSYIVCVGLGAKARYLLVVLSSKISSFGRGPTNTPMLLPKAPARRARSMLASTDSFYALSLASRTAFFMAPPHGRGSVVIGSASKKVSLTAQMYRDHPVGDPCIVVENSVAASSLERYVACDHCSGFSVPTLGFKVRCSRIYLQRSRPSQ